jgi:hypothetical protein
MMKRKSDDITPASTTAASSGRRVTLRSVPDDRIVEIFLQNDVNTSQKLYADVSAAFQRPVGSQHLTQNNFASLLSWPGPNSNPAASAQTPF